jgi:hypothetical protein
MEKKMFVNSQIRSQGLRIVYDEILAWQNQEEDCKIKEMTAEEVISYILMILRLAECDQYLVKVGI